MDLELGGKSVVITGGSGGIGRGLVQSFAAEGCNVTVATRDAAKGQEVADSCSGMPGTVAIVSTDITDWDAVVAMVAESHSLFGPIEVLVNNAGGSNAPTPFIEKSREDVEWETNLNLYGVVNTMRAIGDLALSLASERASFLTGQLISVSGGSYMP